MVKTQLTKEGFEKLKIELQELKNNKKPYAIARLGKARSMGDLSENSEYSAAKEELAFVEGRIQEIDQILRTVEVVANQSNNHYVGIGSTVTVDNNGSREFFQIVGEFEADPMNKKLSHTSPIGNALLDKKVGDMVQIIIPKGTIKYKIIDIK